jgi:MFS family permease
VILASSVGTLIEWYDFYIFGSLATVIANQFFPKTNPTAALLSTLATFAAGFIVRPFGALVFGRLGDLIGRNILFCLRSLSWAVPLLRSVLFPLMKASVFLPPSSFSF